MFWKSFIITPNMKKGEIIKVWFVTVDPKKGTSISQPFASIDVALDYARVVCQNENHSIALESKDMLYEKFVKLIDKLDDAQSVK